MQDYAFNLIWTTSHNFYSYQWARISHQLWMYPETLFFLWPPWSSEGLLSVLHMANLPAVESLTCPWQWDGEETTRIAWDWHLSKSPNWHWTRSGGHLSTLYDSGHVGRVGVSLLKEWTPRNILSFPSNNQSSVIMPILPLSRTGLVLGKGKPHWAKIPWAKKQKISRLSWQ